MIRDPLEERIRAIECQKKEGIARFTYSAKQLCSLSANKTYFPCKFYNHTRSCLIDGVAYRGCDYRKPDR